MCSSSHSSSKMLLHSIFILPDPYSTLVLEKKIRLTCPALLTSHKYIYSNIKSLPCRLNTLYLKHLCSTQQTYAYTQLLYIQVHNGVRVECCQVFSCGFSLSFSPQETEASDLRAGVWFCVVFIFLEQCLYLFLWTQMQILKPPLKIQLV